MDGQLRPWGRTKTVVGYRRFQTLPSRPFSAHGQRACARPVIDLRKSSRARNSGGSARLLGTTSRSPLRRGATGSVPFAITLRRIRRKGGACLRAMQRFSESAGRVGARLRAIQLGAIACKQAPPNRVNLLAKANRLSRRSALTGREPRATFPRPRGGSPGPRPIRAALAARGRQTRAARRGPLGSRAPFARPKPPRLPRPAALTRPRPRDRARRCGHFPPDSRASSRRRPSGRRLVLENQFLGGGGHGVSGVSGRIAA